MWCHKQAKLTIVEIGEEKELQMVMKAVVVQDGTELCTVGFLGKYIAALEKTKFALYDESDNQTFTYWARSDNKKLLYHVCITTQIILAI